MHLDLKALPEPGGLLAGALGRFGDREFLEVTQHLGGQFVRFAGTAFARQESFQPVGLKVRPRLVEGGPGQAKLAGGLGDGSMLLLQGPQAFVFELEQVLRIEKLRALKEGMAHAGMTRVEGAGVLQDLPFGGGGGLVGHICKRIYAALYLPRLGCQEV